ncbi:MAG: hypothetical protein HYZ28_09120 [Myxococcales bacterium]|nr:hypothetical protein [Myxococcales bacterium]
MSFRALAAAAFLLGAAPAAAEAPTVAILYFDYDGKNEEMAMLKKGLAQMLITDLAGGSAFRIVERARLQEIIDELNLNQTRKVDPATANKIGKLLGAKYMVVGGYFDVMGTLRVNARVMRVETSEVLGGAGSHGKPEDFLELEQKISHEVKAILLKAVSGAATDKPDSKNPKKLPAKTALRYAKALDAMDRKDKEGARKELEAVVKEQPDFVLASLDLAALVK